ncbi:MAG: DNA gyrase subunit A [Lentisphaeria bacterium]|jgi:DNA gyrase subunit A
MSDDIRKNDIPAAIEEIMHNAYLQYSLSVNVGRAIPDVRDGFKPGNRRILYAMLQLGLGKSRPYTKCAKVVGEVIGNYHPHGDLAVYDTLVRMAQDFSMRHPLVDGQGNFGSIDGDSPAAYRYTECRLERLAEEMLADIDRDTVEMRPTFDEKNLEPAVLPARFPNLLVNGTTGIGVGMATNIPPHSLGEVIDATVAIIDNPRISIRELMHHLPGPDFPTGAMIMGMRSIVDLYETGRGSIRIRGKATVEEEDGKERIIVTEIPYALNKENLVAKIAELVNEKRVTGISGIADESSSRAGIRIVIDVKRGAMASIVLNQLYTLTPLETVFGAQFLVVDRNRPRTLNLKQILEAYLDHRFEVVTRRTRFELKKAEDRDHIVQGLLIAQAHIDEVVKIIRDSRDREVAGTALMARFGLSKLQAAAILEMRLHQLTNLAVADLQEEHAELQRQIAHFKDLLSSRAKLMGVVRAELLEVKQKYADRRRTQIVPVEREIGMEDLIAREICVVTVSATGYIKRVPANVYEAQNRGGKGIRGMKTKEADYVDMLLTCCTHDLILFFTNKGLMHWLKAYEIPESSREGQGKALVNLLQLQEGERVRAMIPVTEVDVEGRYIVMATKNGTVKKTELRAFKNLRRKGIIAINLEGGDDLIDAKLTDGDQQLLLSAAHGMAVRFREAELRPLGRDTTGVRGMELRGDAGQPVAEIVAMTVVNPADELLAITAQGMGKRTPLGTGIAAGTGEGEEGEAAAPPPAEGEEAAAPRRGGYRLTHRGTKGITSIKLKPGDRVVAALQVEPEGRQELLMTSIQGQVVRLRVGDVRQTGRAAQGVIIMRLNEGDAVATATVVDTLSDAEVEANRSRAEEDAKLAALQAAVADRDAAAEAAEAAADEGTPEAEPAS